jgi:hypothetical protein
MLTDEELCEPSTITLTEALTKLAFDDPVTAPHIGAAIERALDSGRWGADRQWVLDRLSVIAAAICHAGVAGKIRCLGRKTTGLLGDTDRCIVPFGMLTPEDHKNYPAYIAGAGDTLWPQGTGTDEYTNAFYGHASATCIEDVVILREGFDAVFVPPPSGSIVPFTDAEIDSWIRSTTRTGVKVARDEFMKEPRAKGLSAVFERRWKDIKQNPVGRPRVR